MKYFGKDKNADYVRKMFGVISGRYDLLNTLITFGKDRSWRKYLIKEAYIKQNSLILDVGTGTGGILDEALLLNRNVEAFGADFTMEMMLAGKKKEKKIYWCCADALNLPFADSVFDAVVSGYLIRNVMDVRRAFIEQVRTVKPGGRVVCLETSPPPRNLLFPFILLHLKLIIPMLGFVFAGNRNAYRYLTESTRAFKTPEEISSIMRAAGLKDVRYKRFMFGTIAVLSGTRFSDLK
jgi:demethylmenaquinone methyltransferase/2-methoxy-6-polyprenyl-1,4-benzoquinol methylase